MNVQKKWLMFMTICVLFFSDPLNASADRCADVFDKGHQKFKAAKEAGGQKKYNQSIRLYKEAQRHYWQASNMMNCKCPKLNKTAKNNVNICDGNIEIMKKNLKTQTKYQKNLNTEAKAYDKYNKAQRIFEQGDSFAKRKQWSRAYEAYREAAMLWESVAMTNRSENGRKARQAARQARDLAKKARQQKRQSSGR
ncbi:MAG: hypothetical protein K8S27_04715 [Candidatus Omnitrophica bacterium]|nr:hypothetical protein [Candidatus Omnitrophota bacterium]